MNPPTSVAPEAAASVAGPGDRLALRGLRGLGYHGVFEHERRDGQEFVVDVELGLDTRPAAAGDDLAATVHYGELAERLAERWTSEWRDGIEGSCIRPGFIKTGVDPGPLSTVDRKLIVAAALCHRQTGLRVWPKNPSPQGLKGWLGRLDSNQGMAESKSAALPLGYAPTGTGRPRRSDFVRGGRTFFSKRKADQDLFVLYVRPRADVPDEVLLDPHGLSPDHSVSVNFEDVSLDGRLLAYVHRVRDGLFVNAELARRGYAQPLPIAPDLRYADRFADLARDAREEGRGLWSAC